MDVAPADGIADPHQSEPAIAVAHQLLRAPGQQGAVVHLRQLKRADPDNSVAAFGAWRRRQDRTGSERFRRFSYAELAKRDKQFSFWLAGGNLPRPPSKMRTAGAYRFNLQASRVCGMVGIAPVTQARVADFAALRPEPVEPRIL